MRVIAEFIIKVKYPGWIERMLLLPAVLFYRRLRYGYSFRRIDLTRGKFAIVEVGDYERLMTMKWHTSRSGGKFYAVSGKKQKMHRVIMNAPSDMFVDHINGDGLDNRRANLRLATRAQNHWNCRYRVGIGTSRYRGVWWHKKIKKWVAVIGVNGKRKRLGCFRDEKEAARAYDKAAKELHGEFALLNFPATR